MNNRKEEKYMNQLIDKIVNYFLKWDGSDEDAPTMELSIKELRLIADMNLERGRLLKKLNKANSSLETSEKTLKKIKDIIQEEEHHHETSNSTSNPYPNQANSDKLSRIRKTISDMENNNLAR